MSEVTISVPVDLLSKLLRALQTGGDLFSVWQVLDRLQDGRAQLWREGESLIVTELYNSPAGRTVHFWLAAGDLREVLKLSRQVLEWSKANGCVRALAFGRKGWARALRADGWKASERVLLQREV